MIQMIPLKCTNCNAKMEVSEGREFYFCNYCGTKMLIHDTNSRTIKKTVRREYHDDARVFRAETERQKMEYDYAEKMKEQDYKYRSEQANDKRVWFIVLISFLMIVIGAGAPMISEYLEELSYIEDDSYIHPPYTNEETKGKVYLEVEKAFRYAGFSDVKSVPENDVVLGVFKKDGEVDYISINGLDNYEESDWIDIDSEVVIYYHSKRK